MPLGTKYSYERDLSKETLEYLWQHKKDPRFDQIRHDMELIDYTKVYKGFSKAVNFKNNNLLECYTLELYNTNSDLELRPIDPNFGYLIIENGKSKPDFIDKYGVKYEQKWLHSKAAMKQQVHDIHEWYELYKKEGMRMRDYNAMLKTCFPNDVRYISTHYADKMIFVYPEKQRFWIYDIKNDDLSPTLEYNFDINLLVKID